MKPWTKIPVPNSSVADERLMRRLALSPAASLPGRTSLTISYCPSAKVTRENFQLTVGVAMLITF